MATAAQIEANRKNAKKSTGPKTPQGKATSAKNATTHGLTAHTILITGENSDDFDRHRAELIYELNPKFPTEHIITERIVNLSWQLKRCAKLQAAAMDHILNDEQLGDSTSQNPLGKAICRGFAETRALDRLIMYERRIENSLYKSMKQLDNLKQITIKQKRHNQKAPGRAGNEESSRRRKPGSLSAMDYPLSAMDYPLSAMDYPPSAISKNKPNSPPNPTPKTTVRRM